MLKKADLQQQVLDAQENSERWKNLSGAWHDTADRWRAGAAIGWATVIVIIILDAVKI